MTALRHKDIFIVNRPSSSQVTYKAYFEDIGFSLTEIEYPPDHTPPGSEGDGDESRKFVNDGLIRVSKDGGTTLKYSSANAFKNATLKFSKFFLLNGTEFFPNIDLDMDVLSDEIICGGGGLTSPGNCIGIDMPWLSQNIICAGGGSGLESLGDCISIKLCTHSGLEIGPDSCLQVALCDDKGIIHAPGDGCLMIDMSWLVDNIVCGGMDPGGFPISGIDKGPECISVSPEWVKDVIDCGYLQGLPCWPDDAPVIDCDYLSKLPCWPGVSPPASGIYIKNDQKFNHAKEITITLTTDASDLEAGPNHIIEGAKQEKEDGNVMPGLLTGKKQKVTNAKISGGWFSGRSGLKDGNSAIVMGIGFDFWESKGTPRENASGFASAYSGKQFYIISKQIRLVNIRHNQEPMFRFLSSDPEGWYDKDTLDPSDGNESTPGASGSVNVTVDSDGQLHRSSKRSAIFDEQEAIFNLDNEVSTTESTTFWSDFNKLRPKKLRLKVGRRINQADYDAAGVTPRTEEENRVKFGFVAEDVAAISPRFANYVWDKLTNTEIPGTGTEIWDADEETGEPIKFLDGVAHLTHPHPDSTLVPEDVKHEAILAYAVVASQLLKRGKIDLLGQNIPGPYVDDTEAAQNLVPVEAVYKGADGTIRWRME